MRFVESKGLPVGRPPGPEPDYGIFDNCPEFNDFQLIAVKELVVEL